MRLAASRLAEHAGDFRQAAKLLIDNTNDDEDDPFIRLSLDRVQALADEHVHVASRLMNRARNTENSDRQWDALHAILEFDLYDRQDSTAARLSLQALLEQRPHDIESLRLLESLLMDIGDEKGVSRTAHLLSRQLGEDLGASSHLHLAARAMERSGQEDAREHTDTILATDPPPTSAESNLLRAMVGAGYINGASHNLLLALQRFRDIANDPLEAMSYAVEAARVCEYADSPESAASTLADDLNIEKDHPVANEELAHLFRHTRQWANSAPMYARASTLAHDPKRAAALSYRAGRLWQDRLGNLNLAEAGVRAHRCI